MMKHWKLEKKKITRDTQGKNKELGTKDSFIRRLETKKNENSVKKKEEHKTTRQLGKITRRRRKKD